MPKTLDLGPYPTDDGWSWAYRFYDRVLKPCKPLRACLRLYFLPKTFELWRQSLLYRLLGVQFFGKLIPTGGIWVRRLTRARMRAYTLASSSRRGARLFFYRTIIFEALHFPFLLAMLALIGHRFYIGRVDLAVENFGVLPAAGIPRPVAFRPRPESYET